MTVKITDSLSALGMSVRAERGVKNAVRWRDDLGWGEENGWTVAAAVEVMRDRVYMNRVPGVGRKTMNEIDAALREHGLVEEQPAAKKDSGGWVSRGRGQERALIAKWLQDGGHPDLAEGVRNGLYLKGTRRGKASGQ